MDPLITSNPASSATDVRNKGESQDTAVVSGNTATLALSDTSLVCVEYPAVVNNVDMMLESIGGEEGVSKVITFCFKLNRYTVKTVHLDFCCHVQC